MHSLSQRISDAVKLHLGAHDQDLSDAALYPAFKTRRTFAGLTLLVAASKDAPDLPVKKPVVPDAETDVVPDPPSQEKAGSAKTDWPDFILERVVSRMR